jgi:hypothetical protein
MGTNATPSYRMLVAFPEYRTCFPLKLKLIFGVVSGMSFFLHAIKDMHNKKRVALKEFFIYNFSNEFLYNKKKASSSLNTS